MCAKPVHDYRSQILDSRRPLVLRRLHLAQVGSGQSPLLNGGTILHSNIPTADNIMFAVSWANVSDRKAVDNCIQASPQELPGRAPRRLCLDRAASDSYISVHLIPQHLRPQVMTAVAEACAKASPLFQRSLEKTARRLLDAGAQGEFRMQMLMGGAKINAARPRRVSQRATACLQVSHSKS